MPKALPDVTEAELDVLKRLWDDGPASVRQLADVLYPGGGVSHYATVQKLLERLEAKSWVRRVSGEGRVNRFVAARSRRELIGQRLRQTADALCEGSFTPLLTQLAGSVRLTPVQAEALREIVKRAQTRSKGD